MKKLWFLLLTLGAGPACQMLCNSSSCGCGGPPKAGYFDIEGVSLVGVSSTGSSGSVLTTGSSVPLTLLRLRLAPVTRYFTSLKPHSGGAGLAWACSPVPPSFVEQYDSVTVRSRYAYDAQHPAGTPLNDVLLASDYNSTPLTTYLLQQAGTPDEYLSLRLSAPPAAAGPQQFVVRYRLRNGEVYTAETPVFELQP